MQITNGMSAADLGAVEWRKSSGQQPQRQLRGGRGAGRRRQSRCGTHAHPDGPALVYTRAEVAAFLAGVRNGEFDDLAS